MVENTKSHSNSLFSPEYNPIVLDFPKTLRNVLYESFAMVNLCTTNSNLFGLKTFASKADK